MKPWVKKTIAVFCHIPALYLVFYLTSFIWMFTRIAHARGGSVFFPFTSLFAGHIFIILGLLVYFGLWLLNNERLTLEAKLLWALGLIFAAPVAMPVFYWMQVRPTPDGPAFFG